MTSSPPLPYRLKSSSLRFRIPQTGLSGFVPDTRFFKTMRESPTWQTIGKIFFNIRTWSRRTIWGDRVSKASNARCKVLTPDSSSCNSMDQPPFYSKHALQESVTSYHQAKSMKSRILLQQPSSQRSAKSRLRRQSMKQESKRSHPRLEVAKHR